MDFVKTAPAIRKSMTKLGVAELCVGVATTGGAIPPERDAPLRGGTRGLGPTPGPQARLCIRGNRSGVHETSAQSANARS